MSNTEQHKQAEPENKQHIVGGALIQAVRDRCKELDLDIKSVVKSFGFTPIYFVSLSNGHRPVPSLQRETIQNIAAFLDIPVAQAMVMAGKMKIEDFFYEASLEKDLDNALVRMRQDPGWGMYAPSDKDWAVTPLRVKIALVLTFEKLRMEDLIRKAELPADDNT